MLLKKIEDSLNDQIAKEAYASNYYLAMASWAEVNGLRGCADFLYEQSAEERVHMMKLVKFINEAGGHAEAPAIKEPPNTFKSIAEVFQLAFEHEANVTKSISKLVELTFESKDYASFNLLQWYVAEQHEEEKLFRSILDVVKMAGTDHRGLLFIENEIRQIRAKEESKES